MLNYDITNVLFHKLTWREMLFPVNTSASEENNIIYCVIFKNVSFKKIIITKALYKKIEIQFMNILEQEVNTIYNNLLKTGSLYNAIPAF